MSSFSLVNQIKSNHTGGVLLMVPDLRVHPSLWFSQFAGALFFWFVRFCENLLLFILLQFLLYVYLSYYKPFNKIQIRLVRPAKP